MPARLRRSLPLLLCLPLAAGLGGCDEAPNTTPPPARFSSPAADVAGEAMVRSASAEVATETRIEERRGYRLQFDAAEALISAYRETHRACLESADCRVTQGRLQTPRHGLASGLLAMRVTRGRVDEAEAVRRLTESPALSGIEVTRDDRTQQMIDLEARLAQQVVLRERLKALAQEGRGFSERRIQDLLQVERELARVQGEIESMQGRRRHLAQVTETVAITARFDEQRWVEPRQHGVLAPLWRALERSVTLFFESVGQVILVVVFLTPWLVLGLPALWLLSRLWRPVRRGLARRRSRRDAPRA